MRTFQRIGFINSPDHQRWSLRSLRDNVVENTNTSNKQKPSHTIFLTIALIVTSVVMRFTNSISGWQHAIIFIVLFLFWVSIRYAVHVEFKLRWVLLAWFVLAPLLCLAVVGGQQLYIDANSNYKNKALYAQEQNKLIEEAVDKVIADELWDVVKDGPGPSLESLQQSADMGMPEGQAMLARYYQEGIYTPKDIDKAITWYKKAALQGNVTAQMILGDLYLNGTEIKKNIPEAVNWYQKAADAGDANAKARIFEIFHPNQIKR